MSYEPGRGQPGTRRDRITANERRLLEGLLVRHPYRGELWKPEELISFATQRGRFAGCSPQGLHQTAASLVRKRFASRYQVNARSAVEYKITNKGRKALEGEFQT